MNMDELFDDFLDSETSSKSRDITVYSLPGRGRKQCPDCDRFVGVRTKQCMCGHIFEKGKTKKVVHEQQDLASESEKLLAAKFGFQGGRFVYAIGNPPNVHLKDVTYPSVKAFAETLIDKGLADKCMYTPKAIKHLLGHQLGFNSEDYKHVCQHIDTWVYSLVGEV